MLLQEIVHGPSLGDGARRGPPAPTLNAVSPAAGRPDYVELIKRNRRTTWLLVFGFFLLLLAVAGAASLYAGGGGPGLIFAAIAAVTLTGIGYAASPSVALSATGAREADPTEFARVHNLVESMAIAAGIPKPAVYVVDDPAPNAFAAGRSSDKASVAVTTGLLQKLDRDELEGVIAHEIAHIRNQDVRVMTVAVATVGSIAIISDIFFRMLFWGSVGGARRSRGNREGGGNPLVLLAAIVVMVLAPLAAAVMKAAISRQRESLADATAVDLTRYPTGLRKALEKLAADSTVVRRTSHATSHLWIESPDDTEQGNKGARVNGLFNTHPPLVERIKLLRAIEGLPEYEGGRAAAPLSGLAPPPAPPGATPLVQPFVEPQPQPQPQSEPQPQPQPAPADLRSFGNLAPPGWYPGDEPGVLHYWDGSRWTGHQTRG